MKKLNQILQSKYFLITFTLLTITYVIYIYITPNYHTRYDENTKSITGIITNIKIDGNKLTITLKGKEKIIVNYYLKKEAEIKQHQKLKLGDKILVYGQLNFPQENTNFYLFNYKKYLMSQKIYWLFKATDIKLIHQNHNWLYKIKNIIYQRIDSIGNNYLNTFILGNNSYLDNDVITSYRSNGISHLFALSGMHVGLITTCLMFLLNKISKKKTINYMFISIFLLFYMFITNFTPSIVRCCIFFILIFINNKRLSTFKLYIFFVDIMLIINPYSIYNTAFIFSYSITGCLIIMHKVINSYHNYITKLIFISLVAFLVSIPIMINNYHQINVIGPLYNLFYVPFVSFFILPLSLITFVFPVFSKILVLSTNILEKTSIYCSNIKFGILNFRHINNYMIIFYYGVIVFILYKIYKRKYQYLIIVFVVFALHTNINYLDKTFKIIIYDVGQGDSLLIKYPHNRKNILIDTGGKVSFKTEQWMKRKRNYSIAIDTIIPSLKSEGIKKINYLIITHGDFDHMGEAINLVNNFKVEKVIFNCGEFNDLEKELIKVLNKEKIKYYSCIKELNIDNNKLYFLQTKEYANENDNSNVIYEEINGYKFMFMGDAGVDKEKDILEKYNISDVDVLKVGHHGSKTSSSKEFISEINPKYSIISVGKNNRYGHPNKEVLNNLEDSKIYRTDQDGSIMFNIKNNKLKIETCST